MRDELAVLNRNIIVPGCEFSRTGLKFEKVDEATLARVSGCLQEMDAAVDWWWGDYLVAYADFMLALDGGGKDVEGADRKRGHYVRNHGSVLTGGQLVDTQMGRYALSRFYNSGNRFPELSKKHHEHAQDAAGGDLSIALDWLEKSRANNWTSNGLRAAIRASKRIAAGVTDAPPEVTQTELFAAKIWARKQIKRIDQFEEGEAEAMLADLQPILALAAELAKRISAKAA